MWDNIDYEDDVFHGQDGRITMQERVFGRRFECPNCHPADPQRIREDLWRQGMGPHDLLPGDPRLAMIQEREREARRRMARGMANEKARREKK